MKRFISLIISAAYLYGLALLGKRRHMPAKANLNLAMGLHRLSHAITEFATRLFDSDCRVRVIDRRVPPGWEVVDTPPAKVLDDELACANTSSPQGVTRIKV